MSTPTFPGCASSSGRPAAPVAPTPIVKPRPASAPLVLVLAVLAAIVFADRTGAAPAPPEPRAAQGAKKTFRIAAGDAVTAFEAFATQSGIALVYMFEQVRGIRTNAVNAEITPREALERLVARTALTVAEDTATGALVIRHRAADEAAAASGPGKPAVRESPVPTTEEITKLNPFIIQEASETGWVATQSLAGSRLKTDLRDIAAPIEVLTMDFMRDFGLTSFEEATIYTTNVEGFLDNLELGPGLGNGSGFPPPSRIRGIGNGTLSRDFFAAEVPSDNYNLERITIASGPSNLLFGTGNPAGVIDTSLKRAQFRNLASVDLRFDSNYSNRFALDVNRELIKGKLAARLALVHEEKEFEHKPNHFDHERSYGTIQYRPWSKTSFSLHYEDIRVRTMRPSLFLPFDRITPWFSAGSIPGYSYNGVSANRPVYDNPPINATAPALGFNNNSIVNTVFERVGGSPTIVTGPNSGGLSGSVFNFRNTVEVKSPKDVPGVNGLSKEADGWTLLDGRFFSDKVNLGGLSKQERVHSKVADIFITQQIGEHLSFEFGAQRESYLSWNAAMFGYVDAFTLRIDPNRFMPDGVTPNPNAGKFYVEGNPFRTKTVYDSSDWRFSGAYEIDLAGKGGSWWRRLLGRQRLGGLISQNRDERKQGEYFATVLPTGGLGGVDPVYYGSSNLPQPFAANGAPANGWAANVTRQIRWRSYLNGDVPLPSQDMFAPLRYTDSNGRSFVIDMENTGLRDASGRRLGAGRTNALLKREFDTTQLAYQGFFWGNRLVTTLGWRLDTTNSADPTDNGGTADLFTGLRPVIEDIRFRFDPATQQTGSTRTRGFIVRPLKGVLKLPFDADVTFGWNRANTFQSNATTLDPFGKRYPGTSGTGEDKSVRLELWDGKFGFRYTEYENTAGPARAANVPFNRFRFGLAGPVNRVKQLAGLTAPLTPYHNGLGFNAGGDGPPYSVMSNQFATGEDFGLDWNVTAKLQIRFNMNRQKVVESKIGLDWFEWMDVEIPKYRALSYPEGGVNNPRDLNSNGRIDTWTWDTAWTSDSDPRSVGDVYQNDVIANGKQLIQALDGKSNDFVRDARYNINAIYRFTEGRLKGWSIGGAMRFRAAPLIAYGKQVLNGQDALDLNKPFYGREEKLFDLSFNYRGRTPEFLRSKTYRVGLNIRNVLDDADNYPRLQDVDNNPIRMGRVAEGRTFILTVGFDL